MTDSQQNSGKKADFEYGWCHTDHKDGRKIRKSFRKIDFLNDKPYAKRVSEMLQELGLPAPEKEQIFRGTHHDLLFLDSHGVVLRIGPLDVVDLMNPGILQPLGWVRDLNCNVEVASHYTKTAPLTVAIYPGIELYQNYLNDDNRPKSAGSLLDFLEATGMSIIDANSDNTGVIRIQDESGQEIAVEMLLDTDSLYNDSSTKISLLRSEFLQQAKKQYKNKGDVMRQTLTETFKDAQDVSSSWLKAFQLHQPLRQQFWQAYTDGALDLAQMDVFWASCAAATKKPVPAPVFSNAVMHVWYQKEDQKGTSQFIRQQAPMPQVVLYTPWTTPSDEKENSKETKPVEYLMPPETIRSATIRPKTIHETIAQPETLKKAVKKTWWQHFMPEKFLKRPQQKLRVP